MSASTLSTELYPAPDTQHRNSLNADLKTGFPRLPPPAAGRDTGDTATAHDMLHTGQTFTQVDHAFTVEIVCKYLNTLLYIA